MREITKGKWRHTREGGGVDYIMAGNVRIATMVPPSTTARITEREAFGNGETMAASGALLSACRAMRQFLIERHGYDSGSTGRRPLCLIEADGAISLSDERLDWLEGEILGDLAEDVHPYGTDGIPALLPKMHDHMRQVKDCLQDERPLAAVGELEHLITCAAQTIALLET